MLKESDFASELTELVPRVSGFRHFSRVFFSRKVVILGLIIILALIITAIFAPLMAYYDPNKINLSQSLLQPSREHLL